jgi:hypothetical protein
MEEQSNWEYWKEQWRLTKDADLETLRGIYTFVMVMAMLVGFIACVKFIWYLV